MSGWLIRGSRQQGFNKLGTYVGKHRKASVDVSCRTPDQN
jgi:hypothetical protein